MIFVDFSFEGLVTVGGLLWYGYTFPYDKESYIQSLDKPTAYELETLTPKQVCFIVVFTIYRLLHIHFCWIVQEADW